MIHFKLFGIPVRIEPWFWITMVLIGGGLRANDRASLILVAVFVLAGLISITIHELGHALTIRKFSLPTAITLSSFGGYASYPANILSRKQSFLVTAAGPAVQFVFGVLCYLVLMWVPVPPESYLNILLINLIWVSVVWAIFNCLPILPMDGGQMLSSILGPTRQSYVYAVGFIVALLIGLLAYLYLQSYLVLIFMGLFAFKNFQDFQETRTNRR